MMVKKVNIQRMKRTFSVVFLLLFMFSVTAVDTPPALAAGGVASIHMNGGTGYNFKFVFQLAPPRTGTGEIDISGNGTAAANYIGGGSLAVGDQLIYVLVTDSNNAPIGIILPSAIGHRGDPDVLQADGSMGSNGTMLGNTGTINFWFNGFSSGANQQPGTSYLMANKVWMNADGTTPFIGTPPPITFTLTGSTTVGSLDIGSIPMQSGVPVLVLDGDYTITEPNIPSGFRLVNIASTTMQPNLPGNSASVITDSTINNYSATFTNQAIPNNATVIITAQKEVEGTGVPSLSAVAGNFTFAIFDATSRAMVATATNAADGSITFTPIEYTELDAGRHSYFVREIGTEDPSWTIDTTTNNRVYVSVTVTGNNIVATPDYHYGALVFTNNYNARGIFEPEATKNALTGSLQEGQFNFTVTDNASGYVVSTGTNDANGVITFTPITYDGSPASLGTHTYTISEVSPGGGWNVISGTYTMTVNVVDPNPSDPAGTLSVIPTYPTGGIVFRNEYIATGFLNLFAQKRATGNVLSDQQFRFEVLDENGNDIADGTNDANGNIMFSTIEYHSYNAADIGFHNYTIVETSTSGGGWTTSTISYPIMVFVADNGNGEMTVTPFNFSGAGTIFTNVYGSTGSVVLNATKEANGDSLTDGQFEFAVQNEFGVIVATGTNDAAGNITFSPISYTNADVGTHNYTVLETSVGGNGWTPSSVVYNVSVQVVDNGDGTLTATPTYPTSDVIFINTFDSEASIALSGRKATVGSPLAANTFSFAVMDENGTVVSTGTNDANGDILFSAIPYRTDDVGTHNYTIVEKPTGGVSWQTDGTVFNVSVNVAIVNINTVDTLVATATYPADVVFTNTFIPPPAGSLTISKSFSGLPSGFDVFNQNNISPITFTVVGNNSAGVEIYRQTVPFNRANFTFNLITGAFECILPNLPLGTYSVSESGGHAPGYQLAISTPQPSVSLVTSGATFNIANNYTQNPVTVTPAQHPALTVNKVFHGLMPAERPGNFQINITGPSGFNQSLNLNQAVSGSGGTFTNLATGAYTIRESNSSVPGFNMAVSINNSPVTLPYTVQVTSGHITVTIDNTYTPSVPIEPSPRTGVDRSIIIPTILLSLGVISITAAVVLRGISKRTRKGPD